jgi:hypothetical protein
MDPNAALDKALAAARSVLTTYDAVTAPAALEDPDFVDHAAALAEAMTDLDDWFRRGGFLPARWRPAEYASARKHGVEPIHGL